MTIDAILLYGSKARQEAGLSSDIDLLGIRKNGMISKDYDNYGVTFHVYPLDWLLNQAESGTLFLLHIVREAQQVHDPSNFLGQIQKNFRIKKSYREEIEIGLRILLAVSYIKSEQFLPKIRSRFFWGLRTAAMAIAADAGTPLFSGRALENFLRVDGFAKLIKNRRHANLAQCQKIGLDLMRGLPTEFSDLLKGDPIENLRILLNFGGVAGAAAGEILYGD